MRFDTVGRRKSYPDGVKNMWKDAGGNLIFYRASAELARPRPGLAGRTGLRPGDRS